MKRLGNLYTLVGRTANRLLRPVFVKLTGGSTRVRALIVSDTQEVLLVRSWLGYQQWGLPGGGIKPAEPAATAASREVFEETGVIVPPSKFALLGSFTNNDSTAPFTVTCLMAASEKRPTHVVWYRRHEILAAAWFPLAALPPDRSKNVDEALRLAGHA